MALLFVTLDMKFGDEGADSRYRHQASNSGGVELHALPEFRKPLASNIVRYGQRPHARTEDAGAENIVHIALSTFAVNI